MSSELTIVNQQLNFPIVSLVEPSASVFIHIAAEVDTRPTFLLNSGKKRRAIARCKVLCNRIRTADGVVDAAMFDAILIPPGKGAFIKSRKDSVHIARFDVAILIECRSSGAADSLQAHPAYIELVQTISSVASFTHSIVATNARRIAPVDHSRNGVFLFNYFFADSVDRNLAVWDYTAGWFQAETGLDNSTVLLPVDLGRSKYSIINHCRWDSLGRILPSLLFKKSFHSYVLDNFAANNVAAMPILYRSV